MFFNKNIYMVHVICTIIYSSIQKSCTRNTKFFDTYGNIMAFLLSTFYVIFFFINHVIFFPSTEFRLSCFLDRLGRIFFPFRLSNLSDVGQRVSRAGKKKSDDLWLSTRAQHCKLLGTHAAAQSRYCNALWDAPSWYRARAVDYYRIHLGKLKNMFLAGINVLQFRVWGFYGIVR